MTLRNPSDTIRAKRAQIQLGALTLDVFQLPNPELGYRLSQGQIMEAIEQSPSWLSRLKNAPMVLAALKGTGFTGEIVPVKIPDEAKARQVNTLSVSDAVYIWTHFAHTGNKLAISLLAVCAQESIERRANAVFGVVQSERQHNQVFALRQEVRNLTAQTHTKELQSAIGSWLQYHEAYDDKEICKAWFRATHDRLNVLIQGMTSAEIREAASLKKEPIRDFFGTNTLITYARISGVAASLLLNNLAGTNPIEAVEQAHALCLGEAHQAQLTIEAKRVKIKN